ncbi:hypothetical protein BDQ17DRAFT_1248009 [Cyathus striatus]|nr:hypothetical protein BDQ17DRAFT_1248009 [Cyathus striatus]
MSASRYPTIPFVLPLYEMMDEHLWSIERNTQLPFHFQIAASVTHEKLEKYRSQAVVNQYYIIGTSKLFDI